MFVLIAILVASNVFHTRFDLTADKRFTLSENTISLLDSIKEDVYVEVYLDGKLPSSFMRLPDRVQ